MLSRLYQNRNTHCGWLVHQSWSQKKHEWFVRSKTLEVLLIAQALGSRIEVIILAKAQEL